MLDQRKCTSEEKLRRQEGVYGTQVYIRCATTEVHGRIAIMLSFVSAPFLSLVLPLVFSSSANAALRDGKNVYGVNLGSWYVL